MKRKKIWEIKIQPKAKSYEQQTQNKNKNWASFVYEMSNLSTSTLPSPSLDADEPRDKPPRNSPGNTSSLRCTVNEFLPFLPKPMRLFRPFFVYFFMNRLNIVINIINYAFRSEFIKFKNRMEQMESTDWSFGIYCFFFICSTMKQNHYDL